MKTAGKIAISLTALVLVVLQGQACGKMGSAGSLSAVSNNNGSGSTDLPSTGNNGDTGSNDGGGEIPNTGTSTPPPPPLPVDQLAPIETVRVVHKNEFMGSVSSILDFNYSASLWTSFTSLGANLSEDGYVDSVTAPMMNSILSLNGSACSEQLKAERAMAAANRKIFKGFDFTRAPSAQTATAYTDLIRLLSRRAWLRDETASERTAIVDAARTFDTATVADTENKALFICSAILTSLDAITR